MQPIVLEGHGVRLEPLAREHREGLERASADPSVWTFAPEAPGYTPAQHFEAWFSRSLGQVGSATILPFAVLRLADDGLVGSTRYLNAAPEHARVEVGNTWYAPDARASFINPACKLLLMEHAFTVLNVNRFELKADTRNTRHGAPWLALARLKKACCASTWCWATVTCATPSTSASCATSGRP